MQTAGRSVVRVVGRMWVAVHGAAGMAAVLLFLLQSPAIGAFIGNYAPGKFTLVNSGADGTATSLFDGAILTLYGGNNGSGLPGTTDLTVPVQAGGFIGFEYSYASQDWPGYDQAGYLLNGNFSFLADLDGQIGVVKLPVLAGDSFGFRVRTDDNLGEPGILTISEFSGPVGDSVAAIPEPSTLWLCLLSGAVLMALRNRAH